MLQMAECFQSFPASVGGFGIQRSRLFSALPPVVETSRQFTCRQVDHVSCLAATSVYSTGGDRAHTGGPMCAQLPCN